MIERKIAIDVFNRIRNSFPNLNITLNPEDPHVEISMDIPSQHGLKFSVNLNLQNNDELHLNAGALWVEWFPCNQPEKVEKYFESVCGLLSGNYRIVEYRVHGKAIKALLQKPIGTEWETINRWSKLHWPTFVKRDIIIIQNIPAP